MDKIALEEIWKPIEGYEGWYEVSNLGKVKRVERNINATYMGKPYVRHIKERILKPQLSGCGYLIVNLCKNGKQEFKRVNVLVAEAFIPNPNNYEHAHHVNHNRFDNSVGNLEWIDLHEHHRMHGAERGKIVYQFEDDEICNIWKSATCAARALGYFQSSICACCNGKIKTHKGFAWSYSPLEKIKKEQDDLNLALI